MWEGNYRCYGARRVHKQLRREGYTIARCTVVRLMGDMGIRGVQRGRKRFTTVPDATAARPPDLVDRRFVAERPNQLWLADITYASTWQGWLYASFILDVYSRTIVGWQIADHLRTGLVLDALEMAIWRRDPSGGGLIHHSDAGCQYTSVRYSDRLAEAGIAASIGSVGDSYDCHGRSAQRHLQGRARQTARPLAHTPAARDRDHRVGRLVQRNPPPRRDRRHPAPRVRGRLVPS